MKIKHNKNEIIKKTNPGDVFMESGMYFIRVAPPTIHIKDDGDLWGVRLEDGVLTKFGPHALVQRVNAELIIP